MLDFTLNSALIYLIYIITIKIKMQLSFLVSLLVEYDVRYVVFWHYFSEQTVHTIKKPERII